MAKYMKGGAMNVYSWIAILIILATIVTVIVLWQRGMFNKSYGHVVSSPSTVGPGGMQKHEVEPSGMQKH